MPWNASYADRRAMKINNTTKVVVLHSEALVTNMHTLSFLTVLRNVKNSNKSLIYDIVNASAFEVIINYMLNSKPATIL